MLETSPEADEVVDDAVDPETKPVLLILNLEEE